MARMQLPNLQPPWGITAPPYLATDLGFDVRVIEGSVWRAWPQQKIAHGPEGAIWLKSHCLDKQRAEFAAAECLVVRVESGYRHNEALANERKRAKGRRRSA